MFDIESIREIKIIKQNERQTVLLTESPNGNKYLKRVINGDKREIYKTLKKIKHENIPEIYYIGFDSDTIIIEEYIEGISLSDFIESNANLKKKQIYYISKKILSALDKLHEYDIIHRDIKPDNILIDEANHIWLTDYDIARIYRKEVKRDTETMGTFGYAPIEQYGMLPTDFKTDIYAFGATLKTLLDYTNTKGNLYKIAEKCTRLDPAQRYKNVKEIKKAILINQLKLPLISTLTAFVLILIISNLQAADKSTNDVIKAEQKAINTSTFEGTFYGFTEGKKETEYKKHSMFSNVCIFSMQQPWEHILLLEDISKNGKIKIGKNNTIVDTDITLYDGTLSVSLDDGKGHKYSNKFSFNNQYEYIENYSNNLRKNADIICYDFDGDGGTELLIGLNEGVIGVTGEQVYNNFNYCIAWCISYDEETGFVLCEGDMFSKGYAFRINNNVRKLNVSWENIGDITGYLLKDNKIIAN